jgi:putative tryptophan/tyrosine transport system substrate-binding protein
MNRRAFMTLFGGAAAWPLAARAQQPGRMRHIGVLIPFAADGPDSQTRITAFLNTLHQLGWADGRNIRVSYRWRAANAELTRQYAEELAALVPDVILASGGSVVRPLLQVTRTIPVVFTQAPDPVGSGFVASMARPGGNATGFSQFESGLSAKWLELLKQIAPQITRAVVVRDPLDPGGMGQWGAVHAVASSIGVELSPVGLSDPSEFEHALSTFAQAPNGGLIVTGSAPAAVHRELIIRLAARHRLPAIYPYRYFVSAGGLVCYGPDTILPYKLAAGYVDRILRGEKLGDLPVQAPTKFELVINLKTAKALGLEVPPTLLARADEVIE